jgi:hypothetical protein
VARERWRADRVAVIARRIMIST